MSSSYRYPPPLSRFSAQPEQQQLEFPQQSEQPQEDPEYLNLLLQLSECRISGDDAMETLDRRTSESTETFQAKTVYAVGIPPSWDEDNVKEAFKKFGDIEWVVLACKPPKFTTIKYKTREGALSCVASSKRKLIDNGRKVHVHVSLAKPEEKDKGVERRSKPCIMNNLKEEADECDATPTSASASVSSTTSGQASSSTLVASSGGFTTSASLATVRAPILSSEIIQEAIQEEHAITYEWDMGILQNRDVLTKIEAEFQQVEATQSVLVKNMYMMEDHQEKIAEALESMEHVLEELLMKDCDAIQKDPIPSAEARREMERIVEKMDFAMNMYYLVQGRGTTMTDVVTMILEEQLMSLR